MKIVWLMALLLLGGCALFGGGHFPLATSNSEYSLLVAQQQWRVHRDGKDYRLQTVVQINERRWTLVFMDSLGRRLATLVQDQGELALDIHKSHPLDRRWTELAQSLQFIYWPLPDLRRQAGEGWTFSAASGVRQVYFSGILAGQVDYLDDNPWQGTARYANNKSDLHLVIESRQLRSYPRPPESLEESSGKDSPINSPIR